MPSLLCCVFRRKRKRKGPFILLCLGSLWSYIVFLCFGRSLVRNNISGDDLPSGPETTFPPCGPAHLPPSVQLHCQMYHQNIITGDLCAPLCDLGHICDVTSTFGNAHKEVMVTQCHGFCGPGQSVKAILKHDQVSASVDGYEHSYNAMNLSAPGNVSSWMESLRTLLFHHLPNSSLTELFLLNEWNEQTSGVLDGTNSYSAAYNTLVLLFRQKEYVLFRAYKQKDVFPKVYGFCGPLYLVEWCDPVLKRERQSDKLFLLDGMLSQKKDIAQEMGINGHQTFQDPKYISQIKNDEKMHEYSPTHDTGSMLFNGIIKLFFGDRSANTGNVVSMQNDRSVADRGTKSSTETYIESEVYFVNLNPFNDLQKSSLFPPWQDRALAALQILRFLEHLENEETFPEHIHLCDPKLEHFAMGREDGRLKLIDADVVLFNFNMATGLNYPYVDTGACSEHEHCSDIMCRGWCRKETGTCVDVQINNNLQGICENVFLRPSLEFGPMFTTVPASLYDDVRRVLCTCANNVTNFWDGVPLKMPSAAMRTKLVDTFEKSLAADYKSDDSVFFLNCWDRE